MYLLFIWGGTKWFWGGTIHNEGHFGGGGPKNQDFFGPLNGTSAAPYKQQVHWLFYVPAYAYAYAYAYVCMYYEICLVICNMQTKGGNMGREGGE